MPLAKVMIRLQDMMKMDKVGVLFTPGEKQSEQHLAEYQKGAMALKKELVVIELKDEKDAAALPSKIKGLDMLFLTGGTPIAGNLKKIMEAAIAAKVPTAAHTDSFIHADPGVLLGVTSTSSEIGKIAGEALVKVLRGAAPATIPADFPPPQMVMNGKTAKAMGFEPAMKLQKWISKTLD